jgi:chromosome segregation ATPase
LTTIRAGIQSLRVEKERLQDELEAQPSDEVGALEEAKRVSHLPVELRLTRQEMMRKRESLEGQRDALINDREALAARIEASKAELADAKQKYDDYLPERRRRQVRCATALRAALTRRADSCRTRLQLSPSNAARPNRTWSTGCATRQTTRTSLVTSGSSCQGSRRKSR